jgi:membrane protease YdiL (CAAX protease family)
MNTSTASSQSTSASRSLLQLMRKHPLFCFFLIAYAFSWILSIPYVLSVWGNWSGDFTVIFVIKSFGPAIAAIVMLNLIEGKTGVLRLRQSIRQRRASWQWYLFILVGIPALLMLGIIIQPGALAGFQGLSPRLLVIYPIYFFVVIFGGGPLGEEPGWRGFALPRLQPRYGPLRGTLLLGVVWCFWHLPDFLTPAQGGGPGTSLATILTNFAIFFLMVIALAIIFTWVFNHTAGSVFIAIVLHASVNTPQLVLVPLFPAMDVTSLDLAGLIGFGVTALLIVILTRGRLGYKPGKATALASAQIEAQPTS